MNTDEMPHKSERVVALEAQISDVMAECLTAQASRVARSAMTKTEVAEAVALEVRATAHRLGEAITDLFVDEVMSGLMSGHRGEWLQRCAREANYKTVRRLARQS